eukprot:CAMPEP_0118838286 /NCGR_PEP_ID=MMETSP1162-20130426/65514_1 /TAXON_ID=33656 /ORGANISM="Phaeocystis Sp, Strain CCMP2710" /LENGTH=250 /DNA_ID=CAMNT_0006770211 /DNA_START=178 /DNA_END=931 /DNA_ORIENTATION=-
MARAVVLDCDRAGRARALLDPPHAEVDAELAVVEELAQRLPHAVGRRDPLAALAGRSAPRVGEPLLKDARPVAVVVEVVAGEHAVRLHLRPERKDVLVHIRVVVRCVDERKVGRAVWDATRTGHAVLLEQLEHWKAARDGPHLRRAPAARVASALAPRVHGGVAGNGVAVCFQDRHHGGAGADAHLDDASRAVQPNQVRQHVASVPARCARDRPLRAHRHIRVAESAAPCEGIARVDGASARRARAGVFI